MPRATTCFLDGKTITVAQALELRSRRQRHNAFRCRHCDEPVRPHKAGNNMAAHFEHLARNPSCPLSDPARD